MRMAFVCLIILIIVLCGYFFLPQQYFEQSGDTITDPPPAVVGQSANRTSATAPERQNSASADPAEDNQRQAKEQAFAQLAKARRNLDRRLSRVKALLWNKQLPKAEAERIQQQLLNAYGLLKNKKLLGAFHSLEAIEDELTQVNFAYNQISKLIEQLKTPTDE